MAKPIHVNMLGKFTITEEGQFPSREISLTGRSRRLWTLVSYLIIHRDHGISGQELIDLLWPEAENDNPMATLQNNVSRARTALADLGISDAKNLIKYEAGLYKWAPDTETVTDFDRFEELSKRAQSTDDRDEAIRLGMEAIRLYEGDFLPEASLEFWCINLNTYYRSAFIRLCRRTVKNLMDAGRNAEAEAVCSAVIRIDPTVEEFSVLLMRSLIRDKNPRKALEQYEYIRQLYKDTYNVVPSAELEMEKAAAIQELYGQEMGEQELAALLKGDDEEPGAFFCDNGVFREIVNLHVREMKRSKTSAQIALIRLNAATVPQEKQVVQMKRLETVLFRCLRTGDPFTRIGANQFAVLLPGANKENGGMVMNRVLSSLRSEYPRAGAEFTFRVMDLAEMKDTI